MPSSRRGFDSRPPLQFRRAAPAPMVRTAPWWRAGGVDSLGRLQFVLCRGVPGTRLFRKEAWRVRLLPAAPACEVPVGRSFNGRMRGRQPRDAGSSPARSTNAVRCGVRATSLTVNQETEVRILPPEPKEAYAAWGGGANQQHTTFARSSSGCESRPLHQCREHETQSGSIV